MGFFERIARFLWAKEQFTWEKERIAPVAHDKRVTGGNHSRPLFKKRDGSNLLPVALLSRATRANRSRRFKKKSDWAKSEGSDSLMGIQQCKSSEKLSKTYAKIWIFWVNCFFFANHSCCSFLQRDLLTVALLSWATWVNCSWLQERLAHSHSF